jgi:hypothetical protein
MSAEWYGIIAVFVLVAGISFHLSDEIEKLTSRIERLENSRPREVSSTR